MKMKRVMSLFGSSCMLKSFQAPEMQRWSWSRAFGGTVNQRETETDRDSLRHTLNKAAWVASGEKGEIFFFFFSLRSMPESTPGALRSRAERQEQTRGAFYWGSRSRCLVDTAIFSNILQYSRCFVISVLYSVLWRTDPHSSDCCKCPRGQHVKSDYTLSVKETWHPAFSHLKCPLRTHLFIFKISSYQSTQFGYKVANSAQCWWIVLLLISFDLHLRIHQSEKKSGF